MPLSVEAGERIEQLRDAAVRTRGAGCVMGISPVNDFFLLYISRR